MSRLGQVSLPRPDGSHPPPISNSLPARLGAGAPGKTARQAAGHQACPASAVSAVSAVSAEVGFAWLSLLRTGGTVLVSDLAEETDSKVAFGAAYAYVPSMTSPPASGSVHVAPVADVRHGGHPGPVIDPVNDRVRTVACAELVIQRREQALAGAVRLLRQRAGDGFVCGGGGCLRQGLG